MVNHIMDLVGVQKKQATYTSLCIHNKLFFSYPKLTNSLILVNFAVLSIKALNKNKNKLFLSESLLMNHRNDL